MPASGLPFFLIASAVLAGVTIVWLYAKSRLRYVVGQNSLRVVLGGMTLRRVDFSDIRRIRTPHESPDWSESENWKNTFQGTHRLLVIQRRTGRFRKFVVTPKRRYEFRAQLRAAMAKANGEAPETDGDDEIGETA